MPAELPIIESNRKRFKFVLAPDQDFVLVPRAIDRRIYFADDQQFAHAQVTPATDRQPDLTAIARSLLACDPSAIVAIHHDSKGRILGASITPAPRGMTPGPFIAAIRSAPNNAKQITFATTLDVSTVTTDSVHQAADICLVVINDFLLIAAR